MTRASLSQLSFSSGELSPLLAARSDYQRFQSGLARCCGFLPLRQGGVTRAPGTWYRGTSRADAPARLIGFQFARDDAVVLEFTPGFMRVWRYGAPVLVAGTPYQIATPWGADDLPNLQWVQSADVIYIADGAHPVQRLARYALDNWTITPVAFVNGPFRLPNTDDSRLIGASAATGTVTLLGVGNPFTAAMVGALVMLEPTSMTIPLWTGNQTVSIGDLVRYDGNIYELTAGTNTGVNPPVHTEGERVYDAANGTAWLFVSDGIGIARITAFTSANDVTAEVLRRIPPDVLTSATRRFSMGAWSDEYGYPATLEIHEQRLFAAATRTDPRTVWASTAGALEDFLPSTEADGSFAYNIAGRQSQNRVLWLAAGQRGLHIGALGEEYSTRAAASGSAIGPANAVVGLDSSFGSRPVRPIAPDGKPIFIPRDGRRAVELAYAFEQDATAARELSLPAEHLGQKGFEEIAWQSAPLRLAWFRRSSGDLAVMVYDPAEDVLGWATYPVAGGHVESMAVTASANGEADILTLVVRRTIGGVTRRCIEEQALIYGVVAGDDPIRDANHLFCAAKVTAGSPFTSASLPHLAGETVHAWTDAGEYGPIVVTPGGAVEIGQPVTQAIIGLADATQGIRTVDIPAPARDGSSIGRRKRLHKGSGVVLHRAAGGRIRAVDRDFAQSERAGLWADLVRLPVGTDAVAAFSGAIAAEVVSNAATSVALEIVPLGARPLTVLAIAPQIEEAGA